MVIGAAPALAGRVEPGRISATLSPAWKFCAPQTICRSPAPSFTRQRDSLSALGCFSRVITWATTTPSNSPPNFCIPSTSIPSIVRRSANSSGVHGTSTYCLTQFRVTFILKLPQEPKVILIKQPDVVNAIANHRDALDPETESPARPDLRIVADILEHLRMDHAAPRQLKPFLSHLSR